MYYCNEQEKPDFIELGVVGAEFTKAKGAEFSHIYGIDLVLAWVGVPFCMCYQ